MHDKTFTQAEIDAFSQKNNIATIYTSTETNPIIPLSFEQVLAMTPPPIQYVIDPILPHQGICMIYAASGVGKTLFALNLAYAIANGGEFLKYKCPIPRKVLYVDGEMSYNDVHERLVNIIKVQGNLKCAENFHLLTPDKVFPRRIPKIDTDEGQTYYANLLQESHFDTVFFDNLSMLSSFIENKAEQWTVIQDWFLYLRSIGKNIFFIHHAGKDNKGYRGTSKMLDCVNTAISLQDSSAPQLEEDVTTSKKFKISYPKARGFGGQKALEYEVTLNEFGWSFDSMEKTNTARIIEMHFDLKIKPADIASELGINRSHVYRLIKRVKAKGLGNN